MKNKAAAFTQRSIASSPIDIGIIDRISRGNLSFAAVDPDYAIQNIKPNTWMSPGQPIAPLAQNVKDRTWDYPVGYNQNIETRQYEGIGFAELKALSTNYDLMRGAIETCKDQIGRIEWKVLYRDKSKKSDPYTDPRLKFWTDFFAMPDKVSTFSRWTRKLFEDFFVTDAATIHPRFTNGGKLYSLDIFDGATIIPRIDTNGLVPDPPGVAYQQKLKGLPAVDFHRDELIYAPYNLRPGHIYGYPIVEQVIMTVNIALRRQIHIANYYLEGNIPEAIVGVPETWTPEQIKAFQLFWDDMLQGNLAQRRHMKFVPGGLAYHEMKQSPLKDQFDEWLARVICFFFAIPPTPFINQMNRTTSESAAEAAREEGMPSRLQWLKDILDRVIRLSGDGDIEMKPVEADDTDPQAQSEIDNVNVRNGSATINEIRAKRGESPILGGDEPLIYTAQGATKLSTILNPPEKLPPAIPLGNGKQIDGSGAPQKIDGKAEKLSKSVNKVDPINRERTEVHTSIEGIKKQVTKIFMQGRRAVRKLKMPIAKADETTENKVDQILSQLDLEGWAAIQEPTQELLDAITKDGVYQALLQIGLDENDVTSKMSDLALDYAQTRSAELAGKKFIDGELVDNPDSTYAIEDATRNMLRSDIAQAIEEGWSTRKLGNQLAGNYAFSIDRAETIARTETATADVQGNMIAYRESGIVEGKQWVIGDEGCEECAANEAQGVIGLDDDYDSGDSEPPAHPNCRCDILPVLGSE